MYLHCDVNRQKNHFVALWRVRSLHGDVHIVRISCLDEYCKRYDCLNLINCQQNFVPYVVACCLQLFLHYLQDSRGTLWRVRPLDRDVHIFRISCLDKYYKRYDCLNLSIFSQNFVSYVVVGDISPFKDNFSYHYAI